MASGFLKKAFRSLVFGLRVTRKGAKGWSLRPWPMAGISWITGMLGELIGWADARVHEDLRAIEGSCGDNHVLCGQV
jgi:hypothetical protein